MAEGTNQPRITNADLAMILGKMDTRLTVIESTTSRLVKALEGNGKPGLIEDHRCLETKVNNHLTDVDKQREAAKSKSEKWGARTWAVVMVFITQAVALLILFIRTGGVN